MTNQDKFWDWAAKITTLLVLGCGGVLWAHEVRIVAIEASRAERKLSYVQERVTWTAALARLISQNEKILSRLREIEIKQGGKKR
jgi:hypothetical protein